MLPFPTHGLGQAAFEGKGEAGRIPGLAFVPGIGAFPGSLPIKASDGVALGAIGVSGGTGDQDEACAEAPLDAVANELR